VICGRIVRCLCAVAHYNIRCFCPRSARFCGMMRLAAWVFLAGCKVPRGLGSRCTATTNAPSFPQRHHSRKHPPPSRCPLTPWHNNYRLTRKRKSRFSTRRGKASLFSVTMCRGRIVIYATETTAIARGTLRPVLGDSCGRADDQSRWTQGKQEGFRKRDVLTRRESFVKRRDDARCLIRPGSR